MGPACVCRSKSRVGRKNVALLLALHLYLDVEASGRKFAAVKLQISIFSGGKNPQFSQIKDTGSNVPGKHVTTGQYCFEVESAGRRLEG
jgi:hypothetical protein